MSLPLGSLLLRNLRGEEAAGAVLGALQQLWGMAGLKPVDAAPCSPCRPSGQLCRGCKALRHAGRDLGESPNPSLAPPPAVLRLAALRATPPGLASSYCLLGRPCREEERRERLTTNDALSYLREVKTRFSTNRKVYDRQVGIFCQGIRLPGAAACTQNGLLPA